MTAAQNSSKPILPSRTARFRSQFGGNKRIVAPSAGPVAFYRHSYTAEGVMKTSQEESLSTRQMLERMFQVEMAFMQSESKDIRLLADAFHPDVVVHEPTSLPYSGDWLGLEGIAGLMKQMNKAFSKVAVEDLSHAGSPAKLYVSCTLHLTARATGRTVTQPFLEILRFENGLLVEGTPFYFDTAEIDAILNPPA